MIDFTKSQQYTLSIRLSTDGSVSYTHLYVYKRQVAGLQMNTAGTCLGGSTKITIRGNSSLSDNNQPLWIIDCLLYTSTDSSC